MRRCPPTTPTLPDDLAVFDEEIAKLEQSDAAMPQKPHSRRNKSNPLNRLATMTEPIAFKYRAFISYSHADTSWAKWLHRALEIFRIDKDLVGRETATGTIPKSLRPIFRDRDDFTAGHTLTDQTLPRSMARPR